MYYYLMGALKRKILKELRDCFSYHYPQHQDILPNITHKYKLSLEAQKAIVLTNASANPMRLSADNFLGTVYSHVMLANVANRSGLALEWVKEDTRAVQESGYFPTPPGLYYIEMYSKERLENTLSPADFQNVLNTEGDHPFYFYLDSLLSSRREPLLTVSGNESTAVVMNAPVHPGSFRLYADDRLQTNGTFLTLEASESLSVDSYTVDLGFDTGTVKPRVTSTQEPFTITQNGNDTLDFLYGDLSVGIILSPGVKSAAQVAAEIRNGLYAAGVPAQDIDVVIHENGSFTLTAPESLKFSTNALSTANPVFGFTEGFVSPILQGYIFPTYATEKGSFTLTVNGAQETLTIPKGDIDVEDLKSSLEDLFSAGDLSVTVSQGGDYSFDPTTGVVQILAPYPNGTRLEADYKYIGPTSGPYGVERDTANNSALPGVVLAFGKQLRDGDKQVVVVHESRTGVADEFGGRWEVSIDLDIITRDPMTREEIGDFILMYFFAIRKEALTEEGLELTDISFGGESEETYNDTENSYYFNSSISLSFQTDWAIHVPKPLTMEMITPASFRSRAVAAGTDNPPESDLLAAVTPEELNLKKMGRIYIKGKDKDFESIS